MYIYIVTFYTKAKAFESLSSFYDMCAQVRKYMYTYLYIYIYIYT